VSLVEEFVEFAERGYSLDWSAIQAAVAARLGLRSSFDPAVYDPREHPTYWCVPALVGGYVGASERAVRSDTEAFVAGCVVRHCMFDPERPFATLDDDSDLRVIADAYSACRLAARAESSFEERFAAKCLPWKVLLAIGTRSIAEEGGDGADYDAAMTAIVRVYSGLQMVDDWHDRAEDAARWHWNMWVHEPVRDALAVIEPVLRGSRVAVDGLRPHLLRRALQAQVHDLAHDLGKVVNGGAFARSRRPGPGTPDDAVGAGVDFLRRRAGVDGLWRDFVLPGISAGSTECVSAFVAAQLAKVPEGRSLAVGAVRQVVSRPRASGGWGYREDVPEDCDSTAWVLLAAAAAGVELPRPLAERSAKFVARSQDAGGGFATYGAEATSALTPADRPGWFEPEVSVTASSALALALGGRRDGDRLERACAYLARSCRDGLWESYWWDGFAYATFVVLSALSQRAGERYESLLAASKRAIRAVREARGGWGDAFTSSLCLRVLLLGAPASADREAVAAAVEYLTGLATAEGGFPPGAAMLAPGAGPGGRDLLLRDGGVVTTACAVRALHEARRAERRPGRPRAVRAS